jgi:hypothetical protein
LVFSVGYFRLSSILTARRDAKKRKVYRYSFGLSNPFPGSSFSFAVGHHFVEILFVFLTLLDRYPTHRNGWLGRQARETARRWVTFAHGQEPWDPCIVPDGAVPGDAKNSIGDDLVGWTVRKLREDEEVSKNDPCGERRYAGWRTMLAAFDALKINGNDGELNTAGLQLLQLGLVAFGPRQVASEAPELATEASTAIST